MTSIQSPNGVTMNPDSNDPNAWSKSKKKRMRLKRKKIMEETAAKTNDVRPTARDGAAIDVSSDGVNKRRKVDPSETNSTAAVHVKADVTSRTSIIDGDGPIKSLKKKKKKKRNKQNDNAMDASPAKQPAQSASIDEPKTNQHVANHNNLPPSTDSTKSNKQSKLKLMSTLQKSFLARLTSSRFRELNEELYTKPSHHSFSQFTSDPDLFAQYHAGFRRQVAEWPVNPVDVIYKKIVSGDYKKKRKEKKNSSSDANGDDDVTIVVADFGCGDAKLAERLNARSDASSGLCPFTVHSFDLVSGGNPLVTPADMTNVPLPDESVDIGVYCLALMGTNVPDFVREGWRVLKFGGVLRVAEVRSRFEASSDQGGDGKKDRAGKHKSSNSRENGEDAGASSNPLMILDDFKSLMDRCGFRCTNVDQSNKMFLFMDFVKVKGSSGLSEKESFSAKPCIYKRR